MWRIHWGWVGLVGGSAFNVLIQFVMYWVQKVGWVGISSHQSFLHGLSVSMALMTGCFFGVLGFLYYRRVLGEHESEEMMETFNKK